MSSEKEHTQFDSVLIPGDAKCIGFQTTTEFISSFDNLEVVDAVLVQCPCSYNSRYAASENQNLDLLRGRSRLGNITDTGARGAGKSEYSNETSSLMNANHADRVGEQGAKRMEVPTFYTPLPCILLIISQQECSATCVSTLRGGRTESRQGPLWTMA